MSWRARAAASNRPRIGARGATTPFPPHGPASIRPLPPQAVSPAKFDAMPIAAAVAPLAVAAPAEAFTGNIAGIPINLIIVGAAPAFAALVALTVIGTGALQQLGRVLSGESKGYFGEN